VEEVSRESRDPRLTFHRLSQTVQSDGKPATATKESQSGCTKVQVA